MKEDFRDEGSGERRENAPRSLTAVVCLVPTKNEDAQIAVGNSHYYQTDNVQQEGVLFFYVKPESLMYAETPQILGQLDVQLEEIKRQPFQVKITEPSQIHSAVMSLENKPTLATSYTIYYQAIDSGIPRAWVIFFSRKDQGVFVPQPLTPIADQLHQPQAK